MSLVTVSLGSNVEPVRHIRLCLDALFDTFGALHISRVFESEPVGFSGGHNFYNLVVAFESDRSPSELQAWAKGVEVLYGRKPDTPRYSPRALDIDLLTVGDLCGVVEGIELPRGEITQNAFVLQPLAELLPEERHPACNTSYATLWANFSLGSQRLWPVDFTWGNAWLSRAEATTLKTSAR
ncbi:2-amino-4-hydroxy-6-hydroxymethyldihydropteridine diphosphokinase [Halomonas aquamarina]|uniref:2-amino-4-hydroxy-6-hydroxymethyldihydropteridine diphosphokinase n=1 Tax=Vreelandella aquamarina TaxID=77097 RepID=A0ACC5VR57_9GAMM|nr:2-amino-4-hydroxy-6-hydroxymethyldihydropteridine diphosphokinase [Halomonas aquamarina]MBZ5486147.1 2-amino-4-hydroxy-6-hydroxymethyldihydropteridine diphosphokinase [Halomonas aquamarina]